MDSSVKIIVVEDHDELRDVTVSALTRLGYVVRGVDCAEALDELFMVFKPNILVLDLNLPGEDGISIARRFRQAAPHIGIIMVTARSQLRDKTAGYESGADIYLTKPVSTEELAAATRALSRRVCYQAALPETIVLDSSTLQLKGSKGIVDVSDLENLFLSAFAKALDRRLESWQLIELTGKRVDESSKGTLEVQIVRLRKKLDQVGALPPTIKSVRGVGYQLCVPIVQGRVNH